MYALSHLQHQNGTWYWVVHFSRRGKSYSKRFYEPKYGGSPKARKAAIAWRDEQLAKVKALTVVEFAQKKRSNNTSGVPGVHFLKSAKQPEGIWQAKLKIGGRYVSRSFSVRLHGKGSAYKMAVAARKAMLAEAEDRPYLHDRVVKQMAARRASD